MPEFDIQSLTYVTLHLILQMGIKVLVYSQILTGQNKSKIKWILFYAIYYRLQICLLVSVLSPDLASLISDISLFTFYSFLSQTPMQSYFLGLQL